MSNSRPVIPDPPKILVLSMAARWGHLKLGYLQVTMVLSILKWSIYVIQWMIWGTPNSSKPPEISKKITTVNLKIDRLNIIFSFFKGYFNGDFGDFHPHQETPRRFAASCGDPPHPSAAAGHDDGGPSDDSRRIPGLRRPPGGGFGGWDWENVWKMSGKLKWMGIWKTSENWIEV